MRLTFKVYNRRWRHADTYGITRTVEDLDKESFDIFRREALHSGRMTEDDLNMNNEQLLDSLGLVENGKLKRAAIVLFHRNPEKWVTGAYIKIGFFRAGYVETWGRGIEKICEACKIHGVPMPEYTLLGNREWRKHGVFQGRFSGG